MMRILAVAGSSGGHIFPAIGFLDDCKDAYPDTRTMLVLPVRSIGNSIPIDKHAVCRISAEALSFEPRWQNIVSLARFIKSFFESIVILARFKPDIVAGFGSIASIPVVLCAWLFRITVIIHEQNVIPGRANRLLAYMSDRIAISFRQSSGFFAANRTKLVWTGNIVRRSLVIIEKNKAREYFGLDPDKRTILVMGGSQASRRINFGFAKIFRDLAWRGDCQVIHLCGETDKKGLEKEYAGCNASVRLVAFLREMEYAFSAADLAISRAGATTIAELMAYRLPVILIPYPYAYQHQDRNAHMLAAAGCALVVPDEGISAGALREALGGAWGALEAMKRSYGRLDTEKPASLVNEAIRIHHHG